MHYTTLGVSGLRVSEVALGTMAFGPLDEVSAQPKGFPHDFLANSDFTGSWDLVLPPDRSFVGR